MTETTKEAIRGNVIIKDGDHKIKDRNILIKELRKHGRLVFKLLEDNNLLKELPLESLRFWNKQIDEETRRGR